MTRTTQATEERKERRKEGGSGSEGRERDMPETTPPAARSRDGYNYQEQALPYKLPPCRSACPIADRWSIALHLLTLDSCEDPRLHASRSNLSRAF